MLSVANQLLRFCIVGAIGFAIDAGLTLLLTQSAHWTPQSSRIFGFLVAACATWQMNRRFTFQSATGARSLVPYVVLAAVGAAVNFAVFILWLRLVGTSAPQIVLGIALGAIVALGINFAVSRHLIFRTH